ncbi:MAG: hypothetical protein JRI25_24940, partial [Deltaproteobacteria bacterium]|nr:hypothetical protein [Deltaproteobacteria bacterium]
MFEDGELLSVCGAEADVVVRKGKADALRLAHPRSDEDLPLSYAGSADPHTITVRVEWEADDMGYQVQWNSESGTEKASFASTTDWSTWSRVSCTAFEGDLSSLEHEL